MTDTTNPTGEAPREALGVVARRYLFFLQRDNPPGSAGFGQLVAAVRDLNDLSAEVKRLRAEVERLAPWARAGEESARLEAERRSHSESCEDCFCCTVAQCAEHRCPENSVGESICPCTCY